VVEDAGALLEQREIFELLGQQLERQYRRPGRLSVIVKARVFSGVSVLDRFHEPAIVT
jgi:hypothetical protein